MSGNKYEKHRSIAHNSLMKSGKRGNIEIEETRICAWKNEKKDKVLSI